MNLLWMKNYVRSTVTGLSRSRYRGLNSWCMAENSFWWSRSGLDGKINLGQPGKNGEKWFIPFPPGKRIVVFLLVPQTQRRCSYVASELIFTCLINRGEPEELSWNQSITLSRILLQSSKKILIHFSFMSLLYFCIFIVIKGCVFNYIPTADRR